ncbi:MAG: DNA-binding MarR family transcriptional regulator [Polaribacter sp.]|jgi:DNA-binding MarR family transcriptional regulator
MPEFTNNYLGYLLARCSYEVSAQFHQKLKEEGVPVITWRVLSSIRNQADTVNQLAKKVLVNQSTLSKALDRMERDELIRRQRDPEFRSKINIQITNQGMEMIDRLINIANQHEEQTFNRLSESDMQDLRGLLKKLIEL